MTEPAPIQLSMVPLIPDTPEDRRMLRHILNTFRDYFCDRPGAPPDVQRWATETHKRLIEGGKR